MNSDETMMEPRAVVTADWRRTQVAVAELRALPSLRGLARRFAQSVDQDYCPLDEVVAELGRDPALAVNVLRWANAAAVGARERVTGLEHALQLLGVVRVRMMARMFAAMQETRDLTPGFDWSELWVHSAACAGLAERLADWAGPRARGVPATARLAGLLHDMGKIALSAVAPEAYRGALAEARERREPLPLAEQARLGIDHLEAGWIVGQEAELPPAVMSAIAHHEAPERAPEEHRATTALVAVANRLAKEAGIGFSGEMRCEAGVGWAVLEEAAGRRLDAAELAERLEREWAPELRAEAEALRAAAR